MLALDGACPPTCRRLPHPVGRHAGRRSQRSQGHRTTVDRVARPVQPPADLRIWGVTPSSTQHAPHAAGGRRPRRPGTLVRWARARGAGLVGLNPLHGAVALPRRPTALLPQQPALARPLDDRRRAGTWVRRAPRRRRARGSGRRLNDGTVIDRAATGRASGPPSRHCGPAPGRSGPTRLRALPGRTRSRTGALGRVLRRRRPGVEPRRRARVVDVAGRPAAPGRSRGGEGGARAGRRRPVLVLAPVVDRPGSWRIRRERRGAHRPGGSASQPTASRLGWQDLVALGARIGAPPDPLGRDGRTGDCPRSSVEAGRRGVPAGGRDHARAFRHARGVRIDHVMGLSACSCSHPVAAPPTARTYGSGSRPAPRPAIESSRAGGLVVGEDLGTGRRGVRESLADAGVLSTRLLWSRTDRPRRGPVRPWPRSPPTTSQRGGVWSGTDLTTSRPPGSRCRPTAMRARHRLAWRRTAPTTPPSTRSSSTPRGRGRPPSMVATAALDDLAGRRPSERAGNHRRAPQTGGSPARDARRPRRPPLAEGRRRCHADDPLTS